MQQRQPVNPQQALNQWDDFKHQFTPDFWPVFHFGLIHIGFSALIPSLIKKMGKHQDYLINFLPFENVANKDKDA